MSKKYILAAILIAASVIGGYSCMKSEGENQNMSNKGALEYMEQRYGEKFEFIKSHGLHYSTNSRRIFVSCESFPGEEILVNIVKDGKELKYYDNYMKYYFEEQVSDFIVNTAKNYFDDVTFKLNISATTLHSSINLTTTFDEYIRSKYYFVNGHLEVIGESNEKTVSEFVTELVKLGIQFSVSINIPSVNEGYNTRHFDEDEEIYFRKRTLK